jgi:hypothetical protein
MLYGERQWQLQRRSRPPPWLGGQSFAVWREEFDRRGYLIFERVLPRDLITEIRAALEPHLARDLKSRNDFEGVTDLLPLMSAAVDEGACQRRDGASSQNHTVVVRAEMRGRWILGSTAPAHRVTGQTGHGLSTLPSQRNSLTMRQMTAAQGC